MIKCFAFHRGRLMAGLGIGGIVIAAVSPIPAAARTDEAEPPETIHVTGTVRDFRPHNEPGGHPDFERRPAHGWGRYSGNIALEIGDNAKPLFTGEGFKVSRQWRDIEHRQICYCLYDPDLGDTEGGFSDAGTGGIMSAESFAQWYRDELGVNMSMPLTLTLVRQSDGTYLFDDEEDPEYAELGGFFPIDGQLLDESPAGHNFHFTFELHVEFDYDVAANQFFKFSGEDDVFVFIDGRLVIDLGGVHAAHDQFLDLNRLGLMHGQSYRMDFFFAERHKPHSEFRMWTNMLLRDADPPMVSGTFD